MTRASADGAVTADLLPNDPDRGKQWALLRIWAYSAWGITTGDPTAVVAVLDTGVDLDHPDLAGNLWVNPLETVNGEDDDGNGYVDDVNGIDAFNHDSIPQDDSVAPIQGHGTHVAGIVGAVTDNALGIAGVGWNTRVMPLKCLGQSESTGTNAAAIECVEYVIDQKVNHGVNVVAVNTSWGGSAFPDDPFLEEAVQDAAAAGIVWCASAGNDQTDIDAAPRYPACYDSPAILATAATILQDLAAYPEDDLGRETDDLALWSNYGQVSVDLAAPGRDIYSTSTDDTYAWKSGTSQAAPQVAGAVALCAAAFPDETALERVDRILTGVDQIASLDGLVASGGRLNIAQALTRTELDMTPETQVSGVDGDWHTAAVAATFTADDGSGIGVDHTEYKLDDGDWTAGTSVSVSADGSHSLQYRSVDKAGRTEAATSAGPVKIDATAPSAQVTGGDDVWHTAAVTVTLSASDATSGIASLEYRLGTSGGWTSVASGAEVTVSAEGTTTLQYRAADVAGNTTGVKEQTVKIDTVAPEATVSGIDAAWHTAKVTATIGGTDAGSGVAGIDYRPGASGAWTSGATGTSVEISSDGTHPYQYRSRDRAGNVSDVGSFTVKVDATAPVSTLGGVDGAWHRTAVTPVLEAEDATSGVGAVSYRIDGGAWTDAPVPTISAEGVTTIDYRATDVAGNEEQVRTATVHIDTAAPSTKGLPTTAKRGAKAKLRYVVNDATPGSGSATVTRIVVKNRKGKTVRTWRPNATGPVGKTRTYSFTCTLAKGSYSFAVYASDLAGNAATTRVAGRLTVK